MLKDAKFLGMLLLACCVLLAPGLFWSQVPSFRDTFHFYYPQAVWLDQCAASGCYFPQWNPGDGLGSSVNGQGTAAIFYPLRVLWFTPGLDVAQRLAIFILAHLLLAAIGIRFAAKRLGLGTSTSWLAAFVYALSCPVFFQHSNLIYLTSAAWMGFAVAGIAAIIRRGADENAASTARKTAFGKRWRGSLLLATSTSMMLLGGDPHASVNTFLLAGIALLSQLAFGHIASRSSTLDSPQDTSPTEALGQSRFSFGPRLKQSLQSSGWLCLALLLCIGCTAIQWIPTLRHAATSDRVNVTNTQLAQPTSRATSATDEETRAAHSKRHHIYDFSISPWHLLTCVFPTIGGDFSSQNSRWVDSIPAEGRMWIPSLYFGAIPCLLCLVALRRPIRSQASAALGLALIGLLASLGSYTLVWVLREASRAAGAFWLANAIPADPVSGLYWLFVSVVPGYETLRYPGKWSVWFACGGALTAACVYQQLLRSQPTGNTAKDKSQSVPTPDNIWRNRISSVWMWLVSLATVSAIAFFVTIHCDVWLAGTQIDTWLSHNTGDAWLGRPTAQAMAWTLLVATSIPWASSLVFRQLHYRGRLEWLPWLTLVEMAIICSLWIDFVPAPRIELNSAATRLPGSRSADVFLWSNSARANAIADGYFETTAQQSRRLADYQQQFALGKLANTVPARNLSASESVASSHINNLRGSLNRMDTLAAVQPRLDARLRALGVTHRLVRNRQPGKPAQFNWQKISNTLPLCSLSSPSSPASRLINWQWQSPDRLSVEAELRAPTILTVRQFNDGGWLCSAIHSDGASSTQTLSIRPPVTRDTLGLVRIELPAGHWRCTLTRKLLW